VVISPESVLPDERSRGQSRALTRADVLSLRGQELAQQAMNMLAAGDSRGAVQAFREAIATDPQNTGPQHIEAHHGLIRALCDAEQFDAAIAVATALIELTPQDPLAQTSLSIALQKAGHIPEAEAAAGRARILEWKQQLAEPADNPDNAANAAKERDPFA
jgi:Flp pilus assembly protein TadD